MVATTAPPGAVFSLLPWRCCGHPDAIKTGNRAKRARVRRQSVCALPGTLHDRSNERTADGVLDPQWTKISRGQHRASNSFRLRFVSARSGTSNGPPEIRVPKTPASIPCYATIQKRKCKNHQDSYDNKGGLYVWETAARRSLGFSDDRQRISATLTLRRTPTGQ
jgi:hypothetical protein